MKRLLVSIISILLSVSLWAEAAQTISYQAVVRNNQGRLQREANIGVRITILEGSEEGTPVYTETRVAKSNINGLLTFAIGDDAAITVDDLSKIDWSNHLYYLRCEMDIDGGDNYTLSSTSQMTSVPYALNAKSIAPEALPEWARGDKPVYNYTEIEGAPTVPTKVSELTNDAGYITAADVQAVSVPTKVSAFENDADYAKKSNLPKADSLLSKTEASATYQIKGEYLTQHQSLEEYAKKSDIPTVPTTVSSFTNDAGYLTEHQSLTDYAKKSDLPAVPTKVSELTNDAGYLTNADAVSVTVPSNISYFENDANYAKKSELPNTDNLLSKEEATSLYQPKGNYLTNHQDLSAFALKSELPKTSDFLTKTQAAATYQVRGNYLTEHQSLADYAKKSDLKTAADTLLGKGNASKTYLSQKVAGDTYVKKTDLKVAADTLLGKGSAAKTYLSQKAAEDGYVKKTDLKVTADTLLGKENAAKIYLSQKAAEDGYVKKTDLKVAADTLLGKKTAEKTYQPKGEYALKSEIPTVPTTVSSFTNDAGYITAEDVPTLEVPSLVDYAKKTDLNAYAKTEDIPSTDTLLGKKTAANTYQPKGEYLTSHQSLDDYAKKSDIPTIPTKVSAFENDKKYLTEHQSLEGYAKKSEIPSLTGYAKTEDIPTIPTKVSAFENDKKYLTEHQSLEDYAKKSDIPSLTGYAKTTDIPTIPTKVSAFENDKNYLTSHQSLEGYAKKSDIPSLTGYAKTTDIPSLDGYALKSDIPSLTGYAKTEDIPTIPTKVSAFENDKNYLTSHQSLEDYAKKSEIPSLTGYAKTEDIPTVPTKVSAFENDKNYLTEQSLAGYAQTSELTAYAKKTDLNAYAKTEDIPSTDTLLGKKTAENTYQPKGDYAKTTDIPSLEGYALKSDIPSLTGYAKTEDIPTIPTKVSAFENDKNYLTSHQSLEGYAKKSDIPSLTGYAKTEDIPTIPTKVSAFENDKNYLTEHQSLDDYAKKSDIPSLTGYAKTTDIPSLDDYAKKSDIPTIPTKVSAFENDKKYLTAQSLDGYAQTSELTAYAKKTDLNAYAKTEDIPSTDTLLGKKTAANTYQPKGEYAKTTDIPSLEGYALKSEIPTIVSAFENDAQYIKKAEFQKYQDSVSVIIDNYKKQLKYLSQILDMITPADVKASVEKPILAGKAYTVSITTPEVGGTVTGAGAYEYGKSVTVEAVPATGYHFSKWSDGNTDASRTITIDGDVQLSPVFEINSYDVELSASPMTGGSVAGAGKFEHGTSITIKAIPSTGYSFEKWSDENTDASRTITVESALSLSASFAKNSYEVSATASPAEGGSVEGAGKFEHGTSITIKAIPSTGYSFEKWSDGNTDASRTITVESALSLTASFAKNSYEVSATASPAEGGAVEGAGSYEYGSSATLTATASTGYSFEKWSDGNTDASRTITVTEGLSLNAIFEKEVEYIDLGLSSGVLWATMNVGATKPEEVGNYYSWGDVEPKSNYSTANTVGKNVATLKNCGVLDSDNNLSASYDAANQNWGGDWRMPTKEDFEELNKCVWTSVYDGKTLLGCNVEGSNGNSIFLPVSGYFNEDFIESKRMSIDRGFYWTSSVVDGDALASSVVIKKDNKSIPNSKSNRYSGLVIRPVRSQK